MSEIKHTPGPWTAVEGNHQMAFPNQTTVARINYGDKPYSCHYILSEAAKHGDEKATAKIIAAAPELLEALMTFVDRQQRGWHINLAWNNDTKKLIEAAIKKATE